jgi:AP2 domain
MPVKGYPDFFMKQSPRENYGIARIELISVGTIGWQVRMQRRGEKVSRFFSDGAYGGAAESLQAAREWRDAQLRDWQQSERPRTCEVSPRNASGVVGVSRVVVRASTGATYLFWQATWCPAPGQRQSVKFSIKKHGDQTAYQLAIEARKMGVDGR